MKKILIIICFLTCWLGVSAQSLREVWIEMANEATRLEIKLLDNNTLALVQTWMAPAAESKLSLFNLQWQPKEVVVDYKANIVKPESMSEEDFSDLTT